MNIMIHPTIQKRRLGFGFRCWCWAWRRALRRCSDADRDSGQRKNRQGSHPAITARSMPRPVMMAFPIGMVAALPTEVVAVVVPISESRGG